MASRFQTITVPFSGKLSKDVPSNILSLPLLSRVENFIYKKMGALEGRRFLRKITDIPALQDAPLKVYSFNEKLVVFGQNGVYSFDEAQKNYNLITQRKNVKLRSFPVIQKERDVRFPQLANWNNDIYCFYEFNNQVFYKRYNTSNERLDETENLFSVPGISGSQIRGISTYTEEGKEIWVGVLTETGIFVQPFRPGVSSLSSPYQNSAISNAKALILEGNRAYYLEGGETKFVVYNTAGTVPENVNFVNHIFANLNLGEDAPVSTSLSPVQVPVSQPIRTSSY